MRILLDTPILLWALGEPTRLSRRMRESLEDTDNDLLVSVVTAWEIATLQSRGSLTLPAPAEDWLPTAVDELDACWLTLSAEHALATRTLPWHHDDPFDRLLVAQASTGFVLATDDRQFEPYAISLLWN